MIDSIGLANFLEDRLGVKVDIVPADTIKEELKDSILKEAVYI